MGAEVGEGAIDLLLRESGDREGVQVVFFGGEPLLNDKLIEHLVPYGRRQATLVGKQIGFMAVTNGTLLEPGLVDLLAREEVALQVSLDGPPEVQNRQRPTARGEDTYERVLDNIRALQEAGVQRIGIQTTLTSLSPSPLEILEHFVSLGLGPVGMEYVDRTWENRQPWSEADLPAMKKAQEELADYFLRNLHEGRLIPYTNLLHPLVWLYRRDRFPSYCSAGIMMGTVTPDGAIFPCFRFAEEPDLAAGTVFTGLDRERLASYVQFAVDEVAPCRSCWARYLCGAGCPYNNYLVSGSSARPDPQRCALMKHQLQLAVQLFGRIKGELPDLVERIEREGILWLLPYTRDGER
jgi:uncharacterized protein